MIGAIAGDVIGSRFEFNNHRSRNFELFHPHISFFTDDTVLTCAVAKWLLDGGSHVPGKQPDGPIDGGDADVDDLLGLGWSGWVSVDRVLDDLTGSEVGLYLLRRRGADELLYVGEGKIRGRVSAHMKKGQKADHPQAFAFDDPEDIEASFIRRNDLPKHQLLEIENDLIAAHVIGVGAGPVAQFLG